MFERMYLIVVKMVDESLGLVQGNDDWEVYDNDNLSCGDIKQVKKTCFEEIRAGGVFDPARARMMQIHLHHPYFAFARIK